MKKRIIIQFFAVLGLAMHGMAQPMAKQMSDGLKDVVWSSKAVGYLTKILEMNDASYPDINANAAYRLTCYYIIPNSFFRFDYEKGLIKRNVCLSAHGV